MTAPSYPRALEDWWLNRAAMRAGKNPGPGTARALLPVVAKLSDAFTSGRGPATRSYASDAKAWLAYGLFFFPQTFMRIRYILEELRALGFPWPAAPRVLDLGAGTGAATAALVESHGLPGPATLLDRSTIGLDLAFPLLSEKYQLSPRTIKGDLLQPPEGTWDVVLVSYAINEALTDAAVDPAAWLRAIASRLSPQGLCLLCEPLVESAGPFMDRLRTAALQEAGLHIWAPCPHETTCPLAVRRIACHDVRNWRMPPIAQTLNDHLGRSIQDLKFSFLALSPMPPPGPSTAFRLVAPVHATKGKWELTGCAPEGDLRRYEVLKRDADLAERHQLGALERGDRVTMTGLAKAGDAWRGRLRPSPAPLP